MQKYTKNNSNNSHGELGVLTRPVSFSYTPIQLDTPKIKYVSCGATCTILVSKNGLLYFSGKSSVFDKSKQLKKITPIQQVHKKIPIVYQQVVHGESHALLLTRHHHDANQQKLYVIGNNTVRLQLFIVSTIL